MASPDQAPQETPTKPIDDATVRKLAEGLLEIAELAMPDTHFATDSRCELARRVLASTARPPAFRLSREEQEGFDHRLSELDDYLADGELISAADAVERLAAHCTRVSARIAAAVFEQQQAGTA